MKVLLHNEKKTVVGENIFLANSFITRFMGLMFKKEIRNYTGYLISPCNSIHTFFMKFNIDVLFITKDKKIIKIIRNLKPWRLTFIYFKSYEVLEMPSGTLTKEIKVGDELIYV